MAAEGKGQAMSEWTVAVGLAAEVELGSPAEDRIAILAEKLAALAPSVSVGQRSFTVRVAVEAIDAVEASATAVADVVYALEAAGLPSGSVQELEVTEWSLFEKRLEEPPYPDLVGITEIAELLDVSRQRASELARSSKFPVPHADLAAGPVWLKPNVMGFVKEWDRKPGRPKSASRLRVEEIIAARKAGEEAHS